MKSVFLGLGLCVIIHSGVALAAPQIKIPACNVVDAWAAQVNADTYGVAPRLTLPKAFEDSQLVPVFGVGVLAWTQEDVQAASQAMVNCYNEAGKRRDATTAAALANANRALLGWVPRTNAALQKAKIDAEATKKQIDALPGSADLDRGLGVLLKADPAAPDINAYRGIPREVGEPIWRLAQIVLTLANSERDSLYKVLGERRAAVETGMRVEIEKSIAAAPADAAGIISLMDARRRVDTLGDADAKAKLGQSADQRIKEIRDALRQAKPAVWVPPDCLDLYRWSGAPNAGSPVNLSGRGTVAGAFLDRSVVPIFGLSLGAWTDQDVANYKSLRAGCQGEWQALAAIPSNAGANAPELVQLASKGRWIDGADRAIVDARPLIAANQKGQQALAAAIEKVQALPDTPASVGAINQLAADPALAALGPEDRNALIAAMNAKLAAISARSADTAIKGLADIKVASPADLDKLWAYFAQAVRTIPDPRAQQNFRDAFTRNMQEATARMMPEFKAKLDASPASLASVAEVHLKLLQLGAASFQVVNTPTYQIFVKALDESLDAMAQSARNKACADFVSSLGAGGDAKQALWNGHDAITLGEFLCEIAEHGTVNSYAAPGMFSSTSTLKATPLKSQMFTISMHKVEVQAGKPMLVGFEVKDAAQAGGSAPAGAPAYSTTPNGPITVEGWEIFLPTVIGLTGLEDEECMKIINNPAPDQLAPATKVFYLYCWTLDSVRAHVAKAKGW